MNTANNMPSTLTGPDGRTYYNTGLTGIALGTATARKAGWVEGETTYEYWIDENDDSERLHTTADFRTLLD
jgi:hypothetical protein